LRLSPRSEQVEAADAESDEQDADEVPDGAAAVDGRDDE
jgi:hypothetical protein